LKTSKKGTLYAEVNDPSTWEKKAPAAVAASSDDLPF